MSHRHFWGYGSYGWRNPRTNEMEMVSLKYCWTCVIAEKLINNAWLPAFEWSHKFRGLGWASYF